MRVGTTRIAIAAFLMFIAVFGLLAQDQKDKPAKDAPELGPATKPNLADKEAKGTADAVAATAITQQVKVPAIATTVIEGESLVNDASALVAYRIAIAAVLGGSFSLVDAGVKFAIVSFGGLAIGFVGLAKIYMDVVEVVDAGNFLRGRCNRYRFINQRLAHLRIPARCPAVAVAECANDAVLAKLLPCDAVFVTPRFYAQVTLERDIVTCFFVANEGECANFIFKCGQYGGHFALTNDEWCSQRMQSGA